MEVSALEISKNYLRALRLSRKGNSLLVAKYAEMSLANGMIENGLPVKPQEFGITLRNFLRKYRFSGSQWIVSLPNKPVFTTYKTFPNLATEDLNEAVELNISSILPGQMSEVSWGFQEVEPLEKTSAKEVMISSISKKELSNLIQSLSIANVVPIALEPKSLSCSRVLGRTENALILTLESLNVSAVLISHGFPRFAREFELATDEKEQFKNLVVEIRRIINYYSTEKKGQEISEIIVDGPEASKEIVEALAKEFKKEVKLGRDLFKIGNVNFKSLAILGAGLRALTDPKDDNSLSLLPVGAHEATIKKQALYFYGGLANMTVVLTILFILLFFGTWFILSYLSQKAQSQLDNVASQNSDPSSQNVENKKIIQEINPYLKTEASLEDQINYWSTILSQINNLKPNGVNILAYENSKEGQPLVISGQAQSREILSSFLQSVSSLNYVDSVQLPNSNLSENQNVQFTMQINLKKDALKKK